MNRRGSVLLWVVIAVAVILAGGIWYYEAHPSLSSSSGNIPTPSSGGAMNIYTNPTIGLSFSYPSNWAVAPMAPNSIDPNTQGDFLAPDGKVLNTFSLAINAPNFPSIILDHTMMDHDGRSVQDQWAAMQCPSTHMCQNLKSQYGVNYSLGISGPDRGGDYQLIANIATGKYILAMSPNILTTSTDALSNPVGDNATVIAVFNKILASMSLR